MSLRVKTQAMHIFGYPIPKRGGDHHHRIQGSAHSIRRLINTNTLPPTSSSTNFATLERAIASACAQHEHENENDYCNYRRCLPFSKYFVKFGDYSTFHPEVVTLNYVANLAKSVRARRA